MTKGARIMQRLNLLAYSSIAVTLTLGVTGAMAQSADILAGISANRIAVISDGDYVAETYATSVLAPVEAGHKDLLTILSIEDGKVTQSALPISNSVTAAPEILELTPDGRTAFVTERLGERPHGGKTVKDLPAGNRLFAIDLADPANPRLAATAAIAANPESLAVSPDGTRVAVVSNTAEASVLQIVEYANGAFGEVVRYELAALGIEGSTDGPRKGVTATNVQWHPSGRYLGVNINTQDRVVFLAISNEDRPVLTLWGNIVDVGKDPFVGRFSADGRYYLTSNWGRNFQATTLDERIPKEPSTLSVIKLADPANAAGIHERLGETTTGVSAEGIAVSPDGEMIATVNMGGTSFPMGSPRHQKEATVSLLKFDAATGRLSQARDFTFEGVLPEGAVFDLTGEHLLVTVFQGHPDAGPDKGTGIEVFHVIKGDKWSLVRLGRVALPHGAHHVDVAG
jgi:DNA-binding beta-propeller fold protein YncE